MNDLGYAFSEYDDRTPKQITVNGHAWLVAPSVSLMEFYEQLDAKYGASQLHNINAISVLTDEVYDFLYDRFSSHNRVIE